MQYYFLSLNKYIYYDTYLFSDTTGFLKDGCYVYNREFLLQYSFLPFPAPSAIKDTHDIIYTPHKGWVRLSFSPFLLLLSVSCLFYFPFSLFFPQIIQRYWNAQEGMYMYLQLLSFFLLWKCVHVQVCCYIFSMTCWRFNTLYS